MAFQALKRLWYRLRLRDPDYRHLLEPGPLDEVVSIDCETTGLDRKRDEIISIAAIRIRGDRILASQRYQVVVRPSVAIAPEAIKVHGLLEADVANARPIQEILPDLLHFIGGRPLVGYYIDFDAAMLNKHVRKLIGIKLPNPRIEVSGLYYNLKYSDAPPGTQVDLTFARILEDMKLPYVQPARRFRRRADDGDDLCRPQGSGGAGRADSQAPAQGRGSDFWRLTPSCDWPCKEIEKENKAAFDRRLALSFA